MSADELRLRRYEQARDDSRTAAIKAVGILTALIEKNDERHELPLSVDFMRSVVADYNAAVQEMKDAYGEDYL